MENRDSDFGHLGSGTEAIRKLGGAENAEGEVMKKYSALLIVGLVVLLFGLQRNTIPQAKLSKTEPPSQEQVEEPVIKPATPEDPGPIATVVVPLDVLKKQANRSDAETVPVREPVAIDNVVSVEPGKPKHLLHNMFSVNHRAQFGFLIPAHQVNARLHGTFQSFTKRNDPDSSDRSADIDLLLLNDEEFNQFLHGQPQSVTYELNSAHNQMVDWWIPATRADAKTYHLVFINSANDIKPKFVQADFTLTFE